MNDYDVSAKGFYTESKAAKSTISVCFLNLI